MLKTNVPRSILLDRDRRRDVTEGERKEIKQIVNRAIRREGRAVCRTFAPEAPVEWTPPRPKNDPRTIAPAHAYTGKVIRMGRAI